jgi:hypothetical protein
MTAALLLIAGSALAAHDFVGTEQRLGGEYDLADLNRDLNDAERAIVDLELQGKWLAALQAWRKRYGELTQQALQDPTVVRARDRVQFGYLRCLQRYGVETKRPTSVRAAAHMIRKIEARDPEMGGLKKHYAALLRKNDALRQAYEDLKKLETK